MNQRTIFFVWVIVLLLIPACSDGDGGEHRDDEGAFKGEWSKTVRGLHVRLVSTVDDTKRGSAFSSLYVEFENDRHAASGTEIPVDREIKLDLVDEQFKPIASQGFDYSGPVAAPFPVVLGEHARVRLKVSRTGCGVPPRPGVMVCLPGAAWFLAQDDERKYFLRGTLRRKEKRGDTSMAWAGELELKPVQVDRKRH